MCGFFISNNKTQKKSYPKLEARGPDFSNNLSINDIRFNHTLLSLTGEFTPQPIIDEDIVCLFNGEIYNADLKKYSSDIYKIIESYKDEGVNFVGSLDGEFSLVLFDFKKNILILATDVFGTKPMHYSFENQEFGISSYESCLLEAGFKKTNRAGPNETIVYDLKTLNILNILNHTEFTLDQSKNNFEDWNNALFLSVEKRFSDLQCDLLLPLSSGHDSGLISCVLNLLQIPYVSYSINKKEDHNILKERLSLKDKIFGPEKSCQIDKLKEADKEMSKYFLEENIDEFYYGSNLEKSSIVSRGFDDPGAVALTFLLNDSKKKFPNIKVVASGQGGDEIYSNLQTYTFNSPNPLFFDEDLKSIFPWENFYYGSNASYLQKEEYIGGAFGLETRYPLLDKKLTQEYLSLAPSLKNQEYKSPISNFLRTYNYPFSQNIKNIFKVGFAG